ncbi:MAG: diacylglycerol kinase family protein [Candidatus Limnocylindria bacterium]
MTGTATASRRPVALLVNPVAGGKPAAGRTLGPDDQLEPSALERALIARGVDVTVHVLGPDGKAGRIASTVASEGSDVVVGGGDGTVALVAAALVETDATLGILPMGSFNNIARGIGLPETLDEALAVIANGKAIRVDVGSASRPDAESRLFFEAAGVGIDAAGFGAAEVTTRRGIWRGLRAAWRGLRWRPRRMVVEMDETSLTTAALVVTVSNGPYYGFGFTVAMNADLEDGLFEISVFERMSKLDLIRHFAAVARGRQQYEPRIRQERAARVRIAGLHRSLPAHADGQSIGTTPVEFVVRPGALRVFR